MKQQLRAGVRRAREAVALPASSYWGHIVMLAVIMTIIIGARAHDGVPIISKIRPALILALVGGGLALQHTSRAVLRRAVANPVFQAQAMYFAWAAVGVPFALWIGGALTALQGTLPALMLLLVQLLCPPTLSTVDKLQRGFVLGCTGTAINAKTLGYISFDGRLTTFGSLDSNDLAAIMAMATPLALGLISRERGIVRKAFWAGCIGLMLLVLMAAGSRGGMIAIVTSSFVYVIGQRGARRPVFAALCIIAGAVSWSGATPSFQRKVKSMLRGEQDYNYTDYSGRKQVWQRARGYTLHNPVLGVGIGNFPVAEGESCKRDKPDIGCKWSATHNSYLQASAELGVPGLLLFVLLLGRGARAGYRVYFAPRARALIPHHRPELLAALCGYMTSATFLSHAYLYLLFALLGLIAFAAMTLQQAEAALAAPAAPAPLPAPKWPRRPTVGPRGAVPTRPMAPPAGGMRPFGLPGAGGQLPRFGGGRR